jgi:hypothetical protein
MVDADEITCDEAFSQPKSNIIPRSLPGSEGRSL